MTKTERQAEREKFSLRTRHPDAHAAMMKRLDERAAVLEAERQRGRMQGAKGNTHEDDDE